MSKFNTPKNIIKCAQNIGCTCSMYKQSWHTKFEYEGKKTAGVTDYTNQTPPKHVGWIKYLRHTDLKMKGKYLSNVHKIRGAHVQCMNNHYSKIEY